MKVHEALACALAAEGVEVLPYLAGSSVLEMLMDVRLLTSIRPISVRHEASAVAMADGYARASGRPAACVVTRGPGLTNAATPLINAVRHRSPLVVLAGDSMADERVDHEVMAQRAFVESLGAAYVRLDDPTSAMDAVASAFRHVRLGRGPVVIGAPADVQRGEAPSGYGVAGTYTPEIGDPLHDAVRRAADTVLAAERVVVLVGRGAVESGAAEALSEIADRIGALLGTTLQTKGLYAGHPFCVGVVGGFGTEAGLAAQRSADCVLVFGAGLNDHTTQDWGTPTVVHVDRDATAPDRHHPADVVVVGDALQVARALAQELDSRGVGPRVGWRTDSERARIEAAPRLREDGTRAQAGGDGPRLLDPRDVAERVDALLPTHRTVVADGGHSILFTRGMQVADDGRSFLWCPDFGAVGLGLPIAIGAALARAERPTVLLTGDGSFWYALQEIDTAARERIPLVVVVFDDDGYGSEVKWAQRLGRGAEADLFTSPSPDLAWVARRLGARAERVDTFEDLDLALADIAALRGPLVLDVRIDGEVTSSFFTELAETATPGSLSRRAATP